MVTNVVEKFTHARSHYVQGQVEDALIALSGVQLDLSFLEEEFHHRTGNARFLADCAKGPAPHLYGVFACSYHPYLSLEYSELEDVRPSMTLTGAFSNIRCVKQLSATPGLLHEQVVAVFPENFRSIAVDDRHPVYYFVNKFAERHRRFTRPLLQKFAFRDFFIPILELDDDHLGRLICNWVNLHEMSHRMGVMPLPAFLYEKSNRFTAAFEELRADLKTILYAARAASSPRGEEALTALYVLAERLLAYPLLRDKFNFDAVSSVMLWKFLEAKGILSGRLDFARVAAGISGLLELMESMEHVSLGHSTAEDRRASLRASVLGYIGNYQEQYDRYVKYWSQV